jgi:uncharacterized protein (TIGR02145 family)
MIKYMNSLRLYLFFAVVFFAFNNGTKAQYLISGAQKIPYKNDSVILHVDGVRGEIQWQVSENRTLWKNIDGEENDSLYIRADSSAYYRAVITEGTCNPVFSDTVLVAQVYDDRDNQYYDAVKMGTQWWMAQNLNFTLPGGSWYYDNDSAGYAEKYGRLYNWVTAIAGCPAGWHLPGDLEWKLLEMDLGMSRVQADSISWRGTDQGTALQKQGTYQFNAPLGGFRLADGTYNYIESSGTFWTSTEFDAGTAWYRGIGTEPDIHRYNYEKELGFSVRCVRNDPPVVFTDSVFGFTTYSATGTGEIFVDGGAPVISRGFCWSASPSPDLTNNFTSQEGGTGMFTSRISGLSKNTTYYLRSFATNSYGTNYGNTLVFKTPLTSVPTVLTYQPASITQTSAILGGSILDDGGTAILSKGLCWDTLPSPDFSDNQILKGTGTGNFTSTLSGLKINHEYHARAFAINSIDTAFGEEIVFETLPVYPIDTITDPRDGKTYEIVKIGYQWWLVNNLDHYMSAGTWYYDDDSITYSSRFGRLYNWVTATEACPSGWHLPADDEWKILETEVGMSESEANNAGWRGTDQGDLLKKGAPVGFDVLFGGFRNQNEVFKYINSSGTFWTATAVNADSAWYRGFGPEPNIHRDKFDKDMGFSVRCVRDNTPIIEAMILRDSTTRNSAVFEANVVYDGGDVVTSRGICWGTLINPDLSGNKKSGGTGVGIFTVKITGLVSNNTYYARAFAINKFDTAYSDNIIFVSVGKPVITTSNVVSITTSAASSGGVITDDGGSSVLSRGVCWNTVTNPTMLNSKTTNGEGTGSFSSTVTGLQPNTTYYLRAYARTAYDTAYGNEKIFKTLPTGHIETFTDSRDAKEYDIINIGNQWWFAENLNYQISNSYCYDNIPAYCDTFGRLYTWSAALNSCPSGWHLPRDEEFKVLERFLGMDSLVAELADWRGNDEGTQLKEGSPIGFNIKFGGFRNESGVFVYVNSSGTYWTSTAASTQDAWYRGFGPVEENIHRYYFDKDMAFSVRCLETNPPEIIVDSVYNVTKTSARVDAKVISDGGENVVQRGVCYSQSHNPTVFNNTVTSGNGIGEFSVMLSGLTTNRTYYARAYAFNNADTAYSNEISFLTVTKPSVNTSAATSIGKTSAVVGGAVSDDGGSPILERGICYSASPHPSYKINHFAIGTGSGVFSSTLSGLSPNKTYYSKAYAFNLKDTAYGNEMEFKTIPVFPTGTFTDARNGKLYGKVKIGEQWWMADNLNYPTSSSWCYETAAANCDTFGRLYKFSAAINACPAHWHLPSDAEWQIMETEMGMTDSYNTGWRGTDQGTQLKYDGSSGFDVLMGGFRTPGGSFDEINGSGTFWTSTSQSTESAWYRGFGITEPPVHRETFDKDYAFSIRCLKDTLPVLATSTVSLVTDSSVTGGGEIYYDGGANVTARGICIGTSSNPTILNDTTNNGAGIGSFVSYKKGLNPGTLYYVRAYATNSEGTSYGSQVTFTTEITKPRVTTTVLSAITDSSAVSGGYVTSTGGATVTARGVCYGTSPNPAVGVNDTTRNGTGAGAFVSTMKNLQPNTPYYVRAYATNSAGTGYGVQRSFTTQIGLPKVTTATITAITETTATGGGNVTSNGGAPVTARGICWSLTQNPTIYDDITTDGSGTGSFVSSMTSLQPNKTYYVRAYASNSKGTGYGNQVSFITSAALPLVTTGSISNITSSTASAGGNVTFDGGSPVTARGVCWSTGINPTIADSKTTDGSGTGSFTSSLNGLTRNTRYYVRAYATNNAALTGYGDTVSFRTNAELPQITTTAISSLTDSSVRTGGTITDNGGAAILSKGVCWNTSGNPTVADDTTNNGTGAAAFTSFIDGLNAFTTYYLRAYAQNSAGYNYGNQIQFRTLFKTDSLTDSRDSKKYLIVKDGTEWWMAENLNYRDTGTVYYDNDSAAHAAIYGRLYTWTSMMGGAASSNAVPSGIQGVCPAGWHIPSNAEWNNLITDLGGAGVAGSALKETGTTHWLAPNSDATNVTGFTARPGGMVNPSGTVSVDLGTNAYFWTTTQSDVLNAYTIKLNKDNGSVSNGAELKASHYSVRCKKD